MGFEGRGRGNHARLGQGLFVCVRFRGLGSRHPGTPVKAFIVPLIIETISELGTFSSIMAHVYSYKMPQSSQIS